MVRFNFNFKPNVTLEQRIGFEMAAAIWKKVLKDDITVTLEIHGVAQLENERAIGGAVPITVNQHYGVFKQYQAQDATSEDDRQASQNLQEGNTTDFLVNGKVVARNSEMLLTSAQARALGMEEAIAVGNSTSGNNDWERDTVEKGTLDGRILINNSFDWGYNYTREDTAPTGKLDFLSMALHEIGHSLGFVSGMDGTIDVEEQLSGSIQVKDFTVLDLFRHTEASKQIESIDGNLSSLTVGEAAYLSVDNGATNIGDFATGTDRSKGGDGSQASHWKRAKEAMGIMDPTLAYDEFVGLSERDIRAMDILGWDVDIAGLSATTNMQALLKEAEQAISASTGIDSQVLAKSRGENHLYTMNYTQWLQMFEESIFDMGHSQWYQVFEIGYSFWAQQNNDSNFSMGDTQWYQVFEESMFDMGMGQWYQVFEESILDSMLSMGDTQWYQLLEVGYEKWWQNVETYFSTLEEIDSSSIEANNGVIIDNSAVGKSEAVTPISGGDTDDILVGSAFKDLVNGGNGDDLIDGKTGDDILLGEGGNDIVFGADGSDKLYGGRGNDLLSGEAGDDELHGEEGYDILSGGLGNDLLYGGSEKDLLNGNDGNDVIDGGKDNDDIDGGDGEDVIIGGHGEDIANGGNGDDVIYGDQYFNAIESVDKPTREFNRAASGDSKVDLGEIAERAGFITGTDQSPIDFWLGIKAEEDESEQPGKHDRKKKAENSISDDKANIKFKGPDGVYDIIVSYYDQSKGEGELGLEIKAGRKQEDNSQKIKLSSDRESTSKYVRDDDFVTYVIKNVRINSDNKIEIEGNRASGNFITINSVDIISVRDSALLTGAEFYNGNLYVRSQTGSAQEANSLASSLGGSLVQTEKNDEHNWLKHTFGTTEGIVKIDVSESQFNVVASESDFGAAFAVQLDQVRLEAEDFSWSGKSKDKENDYTSGGKAVEVEKFASATTTFKGESGLYSIQLGYLDKDGEGSVELSIADNDTLSLDLRKTEDKRVASRSFETEIFINNGDQIRLKTGERKFQLDYIDFVPSYEPYASEELEELEEETASPVRTGSVITIEAEQMDRSDKYKVKDNKSDGGKHIESEEKEGTVSASSLFLGETGYYDVIVGYFDGNKGEASLALQLNNEDLGEAWLLDQDLGEKDAKSEAFVTRTVATGVRLTRGQDTLKILGTRDGEDKAFVDYIKLIQVEAPVEIDIATDGSSGSDILRGGLGNDTIYGGEGNDRIYGEDEYDTGFSNPEKTKDTIYGGEGNDTIYGNSGDDTLYGGASDQETSSPKATTTLTFEQGIDGYNGTADTKLDGRYYNRSYGNSTTLGADGYDDGRSDYSLIRFDDIFGEQVGQIESNSHITSATIELNVFDEGDRLAIHEMVKSWSEDDTWSSFGYGIQANGTEAKSTAIDVTDWVNTGILRLDVTASLQAWQDDPSANRGWAIISQGSNGVDFSSSESNNAPRLIVETEKIVEDNDTIFGGRGDDRLEGGIGDDRLDGSDAIALGAFEKDILVGGLGSDTFVLGSVESSYYTSDLGNDYARIKDFDISTDTLQLHGTADRYVQRAHQGDLHLHDGEDLIAVLENISSIDLGGDRVAFV